MGHDPIYCVFSVRPTASSELPLVYIRLVRVTSAAPPRFAYQDGLQYITKAAQRLLI